MQATQAVKYKKWSKNFDDTLHHREWMFHKEKVNVTPASQEQCSQLLMPLLISLLHTLQQ